MLKNLGLLFILVVTLTPSTSEALRQSWAVEHQEKIVLVLAGTILWWAWPEADEEASNFAINQTQLRLTPFELESDLNLQLNYNLYQTDQFKVYGSYNTFQSVQAPELGFTDSANESLGFGMQYAFSERSRLKLDYTQNQSSSPFTQTAYLQWQMKF